MLLTSTRPGLQEAPPLVPAAEEKYDPRTLYEKLKEQKDAKQAEFEEKYSIRKLLIVLLDPC